MKLFYCPSCARVYFLPDDVEYLCGRTHAPSIWEDGRNRRFVISQKEDTNKPPWPIPDVIEERELLTDEYVESWVDACPHPEDSDYGDVRRHFGYGAPGGRHLSKEQVVGKYGKFVLKPVE